MSPGVIGSRDAAARVHEHPHGTRRRYQTGCRCPACTTANTAYSAHWKTARRTGRPVLGAHVAGTEAASIVAALVAEGFLKAQIATCFGHQRPVLHWRRGAGVTLRTTIKLRAIARQIQNFGIARAPFAPRWAARHSAMKDV